MFPAEKHAAKMKFNEFGLLQPSDTYFPNGMQHIIDRCHELGFKFGLHLMRGIPRVAVKANTPVKGTKYFAQDIAGKIRINREIRECSFSSIPQNIFFTASAVTCFFFKSSSW